MGRALRYLAELLVGPETDSKKRTCFRSVLVVATAFVATSVCQFLLTSDFVKHACDTLARLASQEVPWGIARYGGTVLLAYSVIRSWHSRHSLVARGEGLLSYLSGERLLKHRGNGGGVILVRALLVSLQIYALAVGLREVITPGHTWEFSWYQARKAFADTIPWFGAIFAAAYAAFYSRFASQWQYLADLYNQLMAAKCEAARDDGKERCLSDWRTGFVEDAYVLHLAAKPMFKTAIRGMLANSDVRRSFEVWVDDGADKLEELDKLTKK